MSDVSKSSSVLSLTNPEDSSETVVRLDADELLRLRAALETVSGSSTAAARLVAAIGHAIEHGTMLVLGYGEGPGDGDERDLIAKVRDLIDQLVPDLDLPSDAAALLARRNAKRRAQLLQEFGALSGEQIAEERSRAANRHALAARWRKEGRIFGVPYRGQMLYPAFQFDDDGTLRPVISDVLAGLPRDRMSEWEVALWWTAANGALGGERPVDLLEERPQELAEAARRLAVPLPV